MREDSAAYKFIYDPNCALQHEEWTLFSSFVDSVGTIVDGHGGIVEYDGHERFIGLCQKTFADRGSVQEFLDDFTKEGLGDDDRPHGTSLRHENGFTKVSLWKYSNACQIRLHIWPEGEFLDSRIHSHRWNLASYCAEGEITAYNYVESNDAEPINTYQLFDAVGGKKNSVFLGKKGLKPGMVYTITRGHGHYLNHRTMHRVRKPAGVPTITLMLSGAERADHSIISEADNFEHKQRVFMGRDEVSAALAGVHA